MRQICPDLGQELLYPFRHFQRVGGGLLDDAERDGSLAVEPHDQALVERPELGAADIGKAHEIAVGLLDDQVVELFRSAQIGLRQHGELALLAFDAAGWNLDILAAQCRLDVLRRKVEGSEPFRIEPDAHGILPLAEQPHLGNAGNGLELILDVAVGIIGDLERGVPVAVKGEMQDRLGVGLALLDDRLLDLIWKAPAHTPDPVAHVRGGIVRIAVELEAHRDLAQFLAADRGDVIDAFDAGERVFQNLGDLGLDDRGAGAGIGRLDGDHRRVDGRIFAHAQAVVGDEADEHEHEAQHRGEDRALDR